MAKKAEGPKVTIDEVEYSMDDLSENAKSQIIKTMKRIKKPIPNDRPQSLINVSTVIM